MFYPHRTRNERVGVCHDKVGIILSVGDGDQCGSSRRLQVPYVTRDPAYPVIYTKLSNSPTKMVPLPKNVQMYGYKHEFEYKAYIGRAIE